MIRSYVGTALAAVLFATPALVSACVEQAQVLYYKQEDDCNGTKRTVCVSWMGASSLRVAADTTCAAYGLDGDYQREWASTSDTTVAKRKVICRKVETNLPGDLFTTFGINDSNGTCATGTYSIPTGVVVGKVKEMVAGQCAPPSAVSDTAVCASTTDCAWTFPVTKCEVDPVCVTDLDCEEGEDCETVACKDTAEGKMCVYTPKDCSAFDGDCHTGVCDEEAGCTKAPKLGHAAADYKCCASNDDCNDHIECTEDLCSTGIMGSYKCTNLPKDIPGCIAECSDTMPCDDKNPCTTDSCVAGMCMHTPMDCAESPEDNPCTTDYCEAENGVGVCKHTTLVNKFCVPPAPECTTDDQCGDGNACTTDHCVANKCVHSRVACEDGGSCTCKGCDIDTGCYYTKFGESTNCVKDDVLCPPTFPPAVPECTLDKDCEDYNACTTDTCNAGVCENTKGTCPAGPKCTCSGCDVNSGCYYTPSGVGTCSLAECEPDTLEVLPPVLPTAECVTDLNCDDHNACTTDTCTAGKCYNVKKQCTAGGSCACSGCDVDTGCYYTPSGVGSCSELPDCGTLAPPDAPVTPVVPRCLANTECDDHNACTTDACVDGVCKNTKKECTASGSCTCAGCDVDTGCYDIQSGSGNCKRDNCTSTVPPGAPVTPIVLPEAQCSINTDCNDHNECTTDTCNAGKCENTKRVCAAGGNCTCSGCDVDKGCYNIPSGYGGCSLIGCDSTPPVTPVVLPQPECSANTECEDHNECTADACIDGVCKNTKKECTGGDSCTCSGCDVNTGCYYTPSGVGACKVTGCASYAPPGTPATTTPQCVTNFHCNDHNACTVDTCIQGVCENKQTVCTAGTGCTCAGCDVNSGCYYTPSGLGSCKIAGCVLEYLAVLPPVDPGTTPVTPAPQCTLNTHCNDHNACTTDTCVSGVCENKKNVCTAGGSCTCGGCDVNTGCYYTPSGVGSCKIAGCATKPECVADCNCVRAAAPHNGTCDLTTGTCRYGTGAVGTDPVSQHTCASCSTLKYYNGARSSVFAFPALKNGDQGVTPPEGGLPVPIRIQYAAATYDQTCNSGDPTPLFTVMTADGKCTPCTDHTIAGIQHGAAITCNIFYTNERPGIMMRTIQGQTVDGIHAKRCSIYDLFCARGTSVSIQNVSCRGRNPVAGGETEVTTKGSVCFSFDCSNISRYEYCGQAAPAQTATARRRLKGGK